ARDLLAGGRGPAAGLPRPALPPRADDHGHLFVVPRRSGRGVPPDRRRCDPGQVPGHAPRSARGAGEGRRSKAPARSAEGVRDAWRAMVFPGPGDLRAEELPVPVPGPGEVVLKIDAALTCGTDVKTLRRGHPVMIPKIPTVFGHEFAGTVSAVGAG